MQRVLGFLAIYSGLKNKRAIVRKTKKKQKGQFQLTSAVHKIRERRREKQEAKK